MTCTGGRGRFSNPYFTVRFTIVATLFQFSPYCRAVPCQLNSRASFATALDSAVAKLARELSWQGTARQYGLNWKSVATIVKRTVKYGLENRPRPPVHVIGIDEVSRRKGQVYLTVVYDLERRVLLWVGDDRTEEAVRPFFTQE